MRLGEKQELFSRLKAEWVLWVFSKKGWAIRPGEGRILQMGADNKGRKARIVGTDTIVMVVDLVHKENSNHYSGLAEDPQLFVDGAHIEATEHPAWIAAGEKWESMHPLCRWGGRFGDGNHISLEHEGVK